jgi:hypothetical protein
MTPDFSLLPNELLQDILSNLDVLSKIRTKAVCKQFALLISIGTLQELTLYENSQTYTFHKINGFIDHIYESLIDTELWNKSYNLARIANVDIVFGKTRVRNKYKYAVDIEINYTTRMRIFYEGRSRRYKCYKFMNDPITIPTLFYVIALRFLIKIYNPRPCDYNFDILQIPDLYKRMLCPNYNGTIFSELLNEDLTIT